jgi:hypothetical protein
MKTILGSWRSPAETDEQFPDSGSLPALAGVARNDAPLLEESAGVD